MSQSQIVMWRQKRVELVENVEWFVSNGIRSDELVKRLETTKGALYRRLLRCGRNDLAKEVGCPHRPYKPRPKK